MIDDAHWADLVSLRALAFALRRLTDERVLVVVAARDDEVCGLPEGFVKLFHTNGIDLKPLGGHQFAQLAQRYQIVFTPFELARFRALSGGSPLYAQLVAARAALARHGQSDGNAVLAERADRAGAGSLQRPGRIAAQRDTVRRGTHHRRGRRVLGERQPLDAAVERVLLATLERARAGEAQESLGRAEVSHGPNVPRSQDGEPGSGRNERLIRPACVLVGHPGHGRRPGVCGILMA